MPNLKALYAECETCKSTTLHEVLKGKEFESHATLVVEGVLKCRNCGTTMQRRIEQEKPVVLQVVLSEGEGSRKSTVVVDADEKLAVGDEMFVGRDRIVVTALETKGTDGKKSLVATEIRLGAAGATQVK